jgi:phosphoglycerate dehydrogenase-like enzyme
MAYGDTKLDVAAPAVQDLVGLQDAGKVRIGPNIVPDLLPVIPPELEHSCRALVCRPTWGGKVTQELVDRLRAPGEPFVVASLSSGASHISAKTDGDTTIHCAGDGNAEQTAELTVFLAICLLRRALMQMVNMGFGVYVRPDGTPTRSLKGITWVVVGAGPVGEAVLAKAAAMGAGTLRAYYAKFAEMQPEKIAEKHPGLVGLDVQFTGDLESALMGADVVSIHVPKENNIGLVDKRWFELLPENAVLVNCARHEVVDDKALVAALESNRLFGYASDVLPDKSERRGANPHSPDVEVWRRACWSLITSIETCTHRGCVFQDVSLAERFFEKGLDPEGNSYDPLASERNMVYTPHIGGSTVDAEAKVAEEVVAKLRTSLGVAP